jgi:hypothetical protein
MMTWSKRILLAGFTAAVPACSTSAGDATGAAGPSAQDAASMQSGPCVLIDADAEAGVESCTAPPDGLPDDLFCTGLYVNRDPSRLSPCVMPYTPGVVFWSDGAEKHRYLYLPPSSVIDTSVMDSWVFPVGTRAWKDFRVDGVLVETRIFWKTSPTNWASGTYVWDADGKTATLYKTRAGMILDSGYEVPQARDCGKCHHGGSDSLLGVEAVALGLSTAQGVTLATLVAAGSLSRPPPTTSITLPEDTTGKAAAALGYLHVNCGMPCHSARGLGEETQLIMRLRADEFWRPAGIDSGAGGITQASSGQQGNAQFEAGSDAQAAQTEGGPGDGGGVDAATAPPPPFGSVAATDTYQATINQPPKTASVAQAFPGDMRITPGAHDRSLVWLVSHRRGDYQMPPLVSHKIDEVGTQKLADWIDALPK